MIALRSSPAGSPRPRRDAAPKFCNGTSPDGRRPGLAGDFRVRIHEERERGPAASGRATSWASLKAIQFISQPPNPATRARRTRGSSSGGGAPGCSSSTTFRTLGGVHRHSAPSAKWTSARQCCAVVTSPSAPEAAEDRTRADAQTVDVTGRQADRARHPDEQRVQIGALAAEIRWSRASSGCRQAAALHGRIADVSSTDPVVEAPGSRLVAARSAHDCFGRCRARCRSSAAGASALRYGASSPAAAATGAAAPARSRVAITAVSVA